jgi:hypothetical protein
MRGAPALRPSCCTFHRAAIRRARAAAIHRVVGAGVLVRHEQGISCWGETSCHSAGDGAHRDTEARAAVCSADALADAIDASEGALPPAVRNGASLVLLVLMVRLSVARAKQSGLGRCLPEAGAARAAFRMAAQERGWRRRAAPRPATRARRSAAAVDIRARPRARRRAPACNVGRRPTIQGSKSSPCVGRLRSCSRPRPSSSGGTLVRPLAGCACRCSAAGGLRLPGI